MRLRATAIALVLIVSACGGAATPAATATPTPSTAPTVAASVAPIATPGPEIYNYVAELKSSNEIPAIADAEASCTGKATITLSVITDSYYYTVSSGKATFDVSLSGCPASTMILLAHIHQGSATQNGPVKVDTGLVAASPTEGPGGRVLRWGGRLLAAGLIAGGVLLAVDGVLDV